ncbi:YALIA101S01e16930g1_1 [Yarrowia lipolytica]|nr:Hypothetical protein YALI2_C00946g [Yarrowia lipolytica]SEI31186.1 YALIA101S01e16930g1_1 [Yarrowia lipolytica]
MSSVMSNNSPSTAATSEFYDDALHTNTVTLKVQCGGTSGTVETQIEALNGRLDQLISGLNSLKGDNMVAVSALSSNMMYLEKQTELMVSYREQQETERADFEQKLVHMVESAVETQFEKQQARLDRVFHDQLNSFGAALLKEQQQALGEQQTLYSSCNNENIQSGESTPAPMLSQIMNSVQTVASETQILRGELVMEMKMYQQQLLELIQNNLGCFLQQLDGIDTPVVPQNPDLTYRSRFSDASGASGGTFRHYPSEQDDPIHSFTSLESPHRFEDPISSPSNSACRPRDSNISNALFSNPRTPPRVPNKEDKTASDISMQDASNGNMSTNGFLASSSDLNICSAVTPYGPDNGGPSEISEMEIFVRNITTRKSEGGSFQTTEQDRKFFTKVSRLFKPKR